jgi:hypothetical protein
MIIKRVCCFPSSCSLILFINKIKRGRKEKLYQHDDVKTNGLFIIFLTVPLTGILKEKNKSIKGKKRRKKMMTDHELRE